MRSDCCSPGWWHRNDKKKKQGSGNLTRRIIDQEPEKQGPPSVPLEPLDSAADIGVGSSPQKKGRLTEGQKQEGISRPTSKGSKRSAMDEGRQKMMEAKLQREAQRESGELERKRLEFEDIQRRLAKRQLGAGGHSSEINPSKMQEEGKKVKEKQNSCHRILTLRERDPPLVEK